jgi:hypothetical protein
VILTPAYECNRGNELEAVPFRGLPWSTVIGAGESMAGLKSRSFALRQRLA